MLHSLDVSLHADNLASRPLDVEVSKCSYNISNADQNRRLSCLFHLHYSLKFPNLLIALCAQAVNSNTASKKQPKATVQADKIELAAAARTIRLTPPPPPPPWALGLVPVGCMAESWLIGLRVLEA